MSKLTIDRLRDLYVHSVRTHETELHLRAKAHRQARENFDALIAEMVRGAKAQAWDEGYKAAGVILPSLPPKLPANPYQEPRTEPGEET